MLKKNIIGIEIRVGRLQVKIKVIQEMGKGDREGVVKRFEALGTEVGEGVAGQSEVVDWDAIHGGSNPLSTVRQTC